MLVWAFITFGKPFVRITHRQKPLYKDRAVLHWDITNHLPPRLAAMATLAPHDKRHKVTVVGSGNWYVIAFR